MPWLYYPSVGLFWCMKPTVQICGGTWQWSVILSVMGFTHSIGLMVVNWVLIPPYCGQLPLWWRTGWWNIQVNDYLLNGKIILKKDNTRHHASTMWRHVGYILHRVNALHITLLPFSSQPLNHNKTKATSRSSHHIMCVTWSLPRILPVFSSLYRHCSSQPFVVTTDSITCENGSLCTAYMPCVSHYRPFLLNHSSHHVCYLVPPPNPPRFFLTIL